MAQTWQYVRSCQSFNHIPLNHTQPGHYKVHVRKADYKICSLKKQTLQTFVVSKSGQYKLFQSQKADTTNFCSLKKRTLQTFVVWKGAHYKLLQSQKAHTTNFSNEKVHTTNLCSLKKRTLQTFVVSQCKSNLCSPLQSISKVCSLCPTFIVFCSLSVNYV